MIGGGESVDFFCNPDDGLSLNRMDDRVQWLMLGLTPNPSSVPLDDEGIREVVQWLVV